MPGHGCRCTELTSMHHQHQIFKHGYRVHSDPHTCTETLCWLSVPPSPLSSRLLHSNCLNSCPPLPGSPAGLCSCSTVHMPSGIALHLQAFEAVFLALLSAHKLSSSLCHCPWGLGGWKAQEKASKESPKWRCWQSSNQTPLCHPRADSLGSSHQHSHRNMEWATHISPSSLKSALICTPVSLKGGSAWLGSKFANLGWGMNWEWKAGTKLLKVKLDDRFTLPKHESHQRLSEVRSSLLQPNTPPPPPAADSSNLQEQRFILVHGSEETIHHGEESMVEGASVHGCTIVAAWLSLASLWFRRWERDCPRLPNYNLKTPSFWLYPRSSPQRFQNVL